MCQEAELLWWGWWTGQPGLRGLGTRGGLWLSALGHRARLGCTGALLKRACAQQPGDEHTRLRLTLYSLRIGMMDAGEMSFSYTNNNTVEFKTKENIIIKMAVLEGDNDLAKIWFLDENGAPTDRGDYVLLCTTDDNQGAPYVGGHYIIQHRKNYVMTGPSGDVFRLSFQKQQSLFANVSFCVKDSNGCLIAPKKPHIVV